MRSHIYIYLTVQMHSAGLLAILIQKVTLRRMTDWGGVGFSDSLPGLQKNSGMRLPYCVLTYFRERNLKLQLHSDLKAGFSSSARLDEEADSQSKSQQ